MNDPAWNPTDLSTPGESSAQNLTDIGTVSGSAANINGLLTANQITVIGDLLANWNASKLGGSV